MARRRRRSSSFSFFGPRRRRRVGASRRRHRRNPPEISQVLSHPTDVIVPGVVGLGAAAGVVTIGNYVQTNFLSMLSLGGTGDILVKAAVRGGVAWLGDEFLMKSTKYRDAYRTGVVIGIVGSALLEFMGKTFNLGVGDSAQMPQQLIGLAGAGAYTRGFGRHQPALYGAPGQGVAGAAGQGAYVPRLRGVGGTHGTGSTASAHARLYGVG